MGFHLAIWSPPQEGGADPALGKQDLQLACVSVVCKLSAFPSLAYDTEDLGLACSVPCSCPLGWVLCCWPWTLANWYSTSWRVEVLILLWGSAVAYSCCSLRMLDWLVWSLVISLPMPGCCCWCPLLISSCLMSEGITSTSARRLVAIGRLDNGPLWLDIPLQNYGFLLF